MTDGDVEHRWSKQQYREDCEQTVIDVCNRLGIHAALELNDQSNNELDDEVRS